MKKAAALFLVMVPIVVLLFFTAVNPPKVEAVPSYARQTGLACSGCHYTPPELNPAGRRFKLMGYVDKGDDTKVIKTDGSKKTAALDLLAGSRLDGGQCITIVRLVESDDRILAPLLFVVALDGQIVTFGFREQQWPGDQEAFGIAGFGGAFVKDALDIVHLDADRRGATFAEELNFLAVAVNAENAFHGIRLFLAGVAFGKYCA